MFEVKMYVQPTIALFFGLLPIIETARVYDLKQTAPALTWKQAETTV